LPQGYSPSGSQLYPLIIFVHGEGELGPGTPASLPSVLVNGTPLQIRQGIFPTSFTVNGQTFKFIVLSPQFNQWPTEATLDTVITYAVQHYKVDVSRIYLTGLSMGGGVVWQYAGNNSVYANRIAAMVPICGASWPDVGRADIIAAGDIPVWATHNLNDPTCPVAYTEAM
jgi:predicted peptidase